MSFAQPPLVLVVDDNPLIRNMIGKMIERMGYRVAAAGGGYEALDKLAALSPDFVTLDVMMPDMTGIEVLHRMASDPSMAFIPVVLLTAMQENLVQKQELPHQMQIRYLEKPFQYERLHQLLEELSWTSVAVEA